MKRALILVEGQTEERFVKDVLAPELYALDLFFEKPTLLVTKIVKDGPSFKGGVTSYSNFRRDIRPLLKNADALVTTLLDYYGLPADFPGMSDRPAGSPLDRVRHVEQAIAADLGSPRNFLPFLALHEFEAWLFSSPDELPRALTMMEKQPEFRAIRDAFASPEEIDDGPQTAPSKRIEALFPAYQKILHGPTTAKRIGLDRIRAECPHVQTWLQALETFARAPLGGGT
jgi:hypothetical protein